MKKSYDITQDAEISLNVQAENVTDAREQWDEFRATLVTALNLLNFSLSLNQNEPRIFRHRR